MMKTLHRTRLASAILAATGGLTLLASMGPADARNIEDELQDQALIFPYYTVREGWTTLANVTNTSPYTLVAKVRYRESYNSRDVLDFNVILSPFDVWTGWVTEGPNGPRLNTRDASCTTPIFTDAGDGSRYADFSNLGYLQDDGPTGIDRTREGHFEVITMGQFYPGAEDKKWTENGSVNPNGNGGDEICFDGGGCAQNPTDQTISWSDGDPMYPTAYYAKHVDGQPRNCDMVDSRFVATASPWDIDDIVDNGGFDDDLPLSNDGNPLAEWDNRLNRASWPDYCIGPSIDQVCFTRNDAGDVLKGNFGLVNTANGIAAGGIAVAMDMECEFDDEDLITAQQYPWFLEPTLYSAGEEDNGGCGLWEWSRQISDELDVASINNEWSFNANTGAQTDWVVTFPTKEFHTDISETDLYAGANPVRLRNYCNFDGDAPNKWFCDIYSSDSPDFPAATEDSFMAAFLKAGGLYFEVYQNQQNLEYMASGFEQYFGQSSDGQSCDTVIYNLWDREETGIQGDGTSISPAPPQPVDSLCYETNVLAFQDDSVLGSDLAIRVDPSVLPSGAAAGWLKLQLSQDCDYSRISVGTDGDDDYCQADELPGVGFAFKARDFGDPTRNFGVLMEHGYDD